MSVAIETLAQNFKAEMITIAIASATVAAVDFAVKKVNETRENKIDRGDVALYTGVAAAWTALLVVDARIVPAPLFRKSFSKFDRILDPIRKDR